MLVQMIYRTANLTTALAMLAVLCAFCSLAATGQQTDDALRWNLETDQQFSIADETSAEMNTLVDQRQRNVTVLTRLHWHWKVLESGDEGMRVQQTLTRIELSAGAPGDVSANRLQFDSANRVYRSGVSGKITKELTPLIGLQATLRLSPQGEISDVIVDPQWQSKLEENANAMKEAGFPDILKHPVVSVWATHVLPDPSNGDRATATSWSVSRPGIDSETTTSQTIQFAVVRSDNQGTKISFAQAVQDGELKPRLTGELIFDKAGGYVRDASQTVSRKSVSDYRGMSIETDTTVTSKFTMEPVTP